MLTEIIGRYLPPPAIPAEIAWPWLIAQVPALTAPRLSPEMIQEILGPGRIWPPQNTPAKGRMSLTTGEHEHLLSSPEALQVALAHLEDAAYETVWARSEALVDGRWVEEKV